MVSNVSANAGLILNNMVSMLLTFAEVNWLNTGALR